MSGHGTISSVVDPSVEMLLREFSRDKLYGEVTVKYEAGRVVLIRRTESIKPANRDNRDGGEQES